MVLLSKLSSLENFVTLLDIQRQMMKHYGIWFEKSEEPSGEEFFNEIARSLIAQVKCHELLVMIEGLKLVGTDVLSLGSMRIQHNDPKVFERIKFDGALSGESLYAKFNDGLWLIGQAKGSEDIVLEKFNYHATLVVGILGICGALLYKGGIWRIRVRAVVSPMEHRKPISVMRWEVGGDNPSISWSWGSEQDLVLDKDDIEHLFEHCFLNQMSCLPERRERSELEDAIVRSIYWFSEAYRNQNPMTKFLKLWTCIENFFTIDHEKVTELNAKGVASILVFSGFNVFDVTEYSALKRRVKKMYKVRSKAVHRAEFGHVEKTDLDDLSYWAAWVVVSMTALSERGYQTLRQVGQQIDRLDLQSSI